MPLWCASIQLWIRPNEVLPPRTRTVLGSQVTVYLNTSGRTSVGPYRGTPFVVGMPHSHTRTHTHLYEKMLRRISRVRLGTSAAGPTMYSRYCTAQRASTDPTSLSPRVVPSSLHDILCREGGNAPVPLTSAAFLPARWPLLPLPTGQQRNPDQQETSHGCDMASALVALPCLPANLWAGEQRGDPVGLHEGGSRGSEQI